MQKFQKSANHLFVFLCLLSFSSTVLANQEKTTTYRVVHNGNVIGKAVFHQRTEGQDTFLKMSSQVDTRMIFSINVSTVDEAWFRNGQLLTSSVYRKINGKEKEARRTRWLEGFYEMQSGPKIKTWNNPIQYNMLLLYCREPLEGSVIYSDNFQQLLTIRKVSMHVFRINMPDGSHNIYHFQHGQCRLVEVCHSLYTIKMELV